MSEALTQAHVDEIVAAFAAALRDGTANEQSFPTAVNTLEALVPITEVDRMHRLLGFVRLLDALLEQVPPDAGQDLRTQRTSIAEILRRQYGSTDTPYVRSRSIVEKVAARLPAEDDADDTVAAALEELQSLDFGAEDDSARLAATMAVHSLRAAHDWRSAYEASEDKTALLPLSLHLMALTLELGGFDRDHVVDQATTIRNGRLSLDGTPNGHALALMVVVGLGLRANPTALPGLDAALALAYEALAEAQASEAAEGAAIAANPSTFAARCNAVIAGFTRSLQRDGFSEHLLRNGQADLMELEIETDEDAVTLRQALIRLLDAAAPHAPHEFAETLRVARNSILAQDSAQEPIADAASLKAVAEAIVQRLRDELAGGGLPAPALTRAIFDLQGLAGRIDESYGEEAAKTVMRLAPEVLTIAAQYAEADKRILADDVVDMLGQGLKPMVDAIGDDPVRTEIAWQFVLREARRFADRPTADPFEQAGAPAYQRQFAALLRPLMNRLASVAGADLAESDEAEAERISSRVNTAIERLRAATTEAQWIEHLRSSFRRAMIDLRRFERRHHLMLIEPPWPTALAGVDANAVFFSGGTAAHHVLDAACAQIGMDAPAAHGVDDPTHTRWDLLRRSAVAAFDFTSYDRSTVDPPGALPRAANKRAAIATAAAPVARVAYECGWALVLGMPIVTIALPDQSLPFDIDIEPVRLHSDGDDAMRVTTALQGALLGVQRGGRSVDLGPTVSRLRQFFRREPDTEPLLSALEDSRDAMQIQLGANALLEGIQHKRAMLALPAFPPMYPSDQGPRTLFHVTAFRSWSKACQEVVRTCCVSADLEYRIGYEHLDPDILHAIWRDIACSSFVVADLTNLNPNAALELAIAQALGRPTLVLSQTPDLSVHLPALAKVRVHTYASDAAGRRDLSKLVDRFLGASTGD